VTQNGEGQEAPGASAPQVLTFGAPTVGEVLAERYQLEEHINNDSLGRQMWRGVDVVLRRPVAVVLRYPGGDSASEMLSAAVAASRIVHPHLVGVYDAIDEEDRAYVVREWVDGSSLRELVAENPLDPGRSATVACAVADAVAAIHATGMAHGNIHPGTVLIAGDGRVVLADARADEAATPEADLRAIGAVLYCALTGYWPHAEVGPTPVPDGIRDGEGHLAAPRQVRAGVPAYLDELTMDLLNPSLTLPAADVLVGELSRFEQDGSHPLFATEEALGFQAFDANAEIAEQPRRGNRKILVGVVGLLVIALAGVLGAVQLLSGPSKANIEGGAVGGTSGPQRTGSGPAPIKLAPDQIRAIDSPTGTRTELVNANYAVDGDTGTAWKTECYRGRPDFGGLKKGMGLLLDLGSAKRVASLQVQMTQRGASVELHAGNKDPGPSSATSDGAILDGLQSDYPLVGQPNDDAGTTVALPGSPDPVRYLILWITKLPVGGGGCNGYQVGVDEITVDVQS
jgi:eukaryotic-like serine/threonine-protein kinase